MLGMARQWRSDSVKFEGDDNKFIHAVWSRSGKRVIISVGTWDPAGQVELAPDQAEDLARFLAAGPDES